MLRPFDYNQSDYATEPGWAGPGTVRDSLGMLLCAANASDPASGNATTCACSQWVRADTSPLVPKSPFLAKFVCREPVLAMIIVFHGCENSQKGAGL